MDPSSTASAEAEAPPANQALRNEEDAQFLLQARKAHSLTVYEAPLRLWHWVNASAIVVLCVTGYFIGQPLPSLSGEASAHFLMGYIRFAHFAAAYIFAIGLLGRIYWAVVGNAQARELFTLPVTSRAYWSSVLGVVKWYLFLQESPGRYVGHNPLARIAMVTGYSLVSLFMLCTGFSLYGEGSQAGSWSERLFGWVIPLLGGSQNVHTLHRLGMWGLVLFVMVHIYAVIRDDIVGKQSIVSAMISGRRAFKE